ncbi:MAG: methyltransferase [Alphaproteobacteria bacterium]|nr:methyltransferase [Alphaproteobacteria bacterium]
MTATDPSIELMRLINGYQVSQALHVAATLGIADQLKDGPKSYDAVAHACGAHPPSLYRLLRALAAVGVFHESGNKQFSLTPLGFCLTSDAPGSTRNYARWIGQRGQWGSWRNLLHSVNSGESALGFTYGTDAWTYRMQHPDEQAVFDSAMTGNSRTEAQAVLEAYDFSRFECVVDVGGGQGLLLKTILLACPRSRGILFDQRQVIASAGEALTSTELGQRCQLIAGSFFETVPAGGDVYVMKVILHDWDDRTSINILRTCRRAMSPTATLVVVERVIGPPNEMPEGKFSDLNMMVQYAAMERTSQEFDDLLKNGGFKMTEIIPTRSPQSIIVAQPMSTE